MKTYRDVMMIYPRKSLINNGFEWLKEEGRKAGLEVSTELDDTVGLDISDGVSLTVSGVSRPLPDIVVMRCYDASLSAAFESLGVRVVNTTVSMMQAYNKGLTHVALASASIPMPETLWTVAPDYEAARSRFGARFVVKSPVGSKGEKVWIVSSQRDYDAVVPLCEGGVVAQRYVEEAAGSDMRLWVIGGRVAASVRRIGCGDFRSNYSLGGRIEPCTPTDRQMSLATLAAKVLGLEFAGVDIMESAAGPLVCEVNGNAGFRSVSALGTANIPACLFDYLAQLP